MNPAVGKGNQAIASPFRRVSKPRASVAEVIYQCFTGTTCALLFHFSTTFSVIPVELVKVPLLFSQTPFFFPEWRWGDHMQQQRHLCVFTWWGRSRLGGEHPSLRAFGEEGEQGRQKKVKHRPSLCAVPQPTLILCLTGHCAGLRETWSPDLLSPSEIEILLGCSSHVSAYCWLLDLADNRDVHPGKGTLKFNQNASAHCRGSKGEGTMGEVAVFTWPCRKSCLTLAIDHLHICGFLRIRKLFSPSVSWNGWNVQVHRTHPSVKSSCESFLAPLNGNIKTFFEKKIYQNLTFFFSSFPWRYSLIILTVM